jgi:hypothetical protein
MERKSFPVLGTEKTVSQRSGNTESGGVFRSLTCVFGGEGSLGFCLARASFFASSSERRFQG